MLVVALAVALGLVAMVPRVSVETGLNPYLAAVPEGPLWGIVLQGDPEGTVREPHGLPSWLMDVPAACTPAVPDEPLPPYVRSCPYPDQLTLSYFCS